MMWVDVNLIEIMYGVVLSWYNKYRNHIYFGWGPGDMIWEMMMYAALITHGCVLLVSYDHHELQYFWLHALIFGIFWLLISLKPFLYWMSRR